MREYSKSWSRLNRPKVNASKRKQRAGKHTEIWLRYARRHPEKVKAHRKLHDALERGLVVKQTCRDCGAPAQAHHPDYSKPLEVIWLCPQHHSDEHKRICTENP